MKVSTKITIKNLLVKYSDDLALNVKDAEIEGNVIAVIGHNGAGKSTFIKTILGLLRPTTGTLSTTYSDPLNQESFQIIPEKHMAFCPETGSIFADISVESYVKLWCRVKHNDGNYYKKEGAYYVDLFDLKPLFKKLGRTLSKGQRRRVQTAIGFLINPKLFLFDEPFDGLDVQKTHELTNIISEHSPKMSFLITSHRMDVMERLADSFIVIKNGEFISTGSIEKICFELCGESYLISSLSEIENILPLLLKSHTDIVSSNIGNQITLTGKNLSFQMLAEFFNNNGIKPPNIEKIRPTLVDAMNYHLKNNP